MGTEDGVNALERLYIMHCEAFCHQHPNSNWDNDCRYADLYDGLPTEEGREMIRKILPLDVPQPIWANPERIICGNTIRHKSMANIIGLGSRDYTLDNGIFNDFHAFDLWKDGKGLLVDNWINFIKNTPYSSVLIIADIIMVWWLIYTKEGGEEKLGPFHIFANHMRVARKYSGENPAQLTIWKNPWKYVQ